MQINTFCKIETPFVRLHLFSASIYLRTLSGKSSLDIKATSLAERLSLLPSLLDLSALEQLPKN